MSNSNWSASAVQHPSPIPAPEKPPGMTLTEAVGHLRQGRKMIHADWQPWEFIAISEDGLFRDESGDPVDLDCTFPTLESMDHRCWYLYEGPVAPEPTIEDVPPREIIVAKAAQSGATATAEAAMQFQGLALRLTHLTTVESLEALVAGKRVRQISPQRGSIWHLRDGYFRSDAGHCCDTISISATDLIQSRYVIES